MLRYNYGLFQHFRAVALQGAFCETLSIDQIMEAFHMANAAFAVDIFNIFNEKCKTENFIFSPLTISSTLALAYKAAKGNTATEMKKGLHYENVKDFDFGFQTLSSDINRISSASSLKMVKRLYVDASCNCTKMSASNSGRKRSRKSHHRLCCQQPLSDDTDGDLCIYCITPPPPTGNLSADFFAWFKHQLPGSFNYAKREKVAGKSPPDSTALYDSSEHDSYINESSSDLEDSEDYFLLDMDKFPTLLKAVKDTIESDRNVDHKSKKEQLFYFPVSKNKLLPSHPVLSEWIERDWSKPDKRIDLGPRFKSLYRVEESAYKKWENIPKVDLAVAQLSKKAIFPSEESSLLSDPMDRKADSRLKKIRFLIPKTFHLFNDGCLVI
ncbi:hypothetical protein GDO81_011817 [Engystomops pustulosus]|uniref:Serpin domain-containing protein n=1 Tax=Engystomops pustulosus TaxID=76066 RepID=A0AAV7BH08_ENGPU|nr:hypothetical protein GDO81_011817 [Engystomops pustulosus]